MVGSIRLRVHGGSGIPVTPVITVPTTLVSSVPGVYEPGNTLTATPPSFTPTAAGLGPAVWTYEDDTPVPGAVGNSYVMQSADEDHDIIVDYLVSYGGLTVHSASEPVGPVAVPVPPGLPVVANQTLDFGRLTRAGQGGVAPINTGSPITLGCSIDSGTNANHWQISATTGVITPSAAGVAAGLSASYSLGCTFGNGSGSDTATITLSTAGTINTVSLATAYSVATAAEIAALMVTPGVATLSGKGVLMRPGTYAWSNTTWGSRAFSSQTTFTSHDDSNHALLDITRPAGVTNNFDNPKNLRWYRLRVSAIYDYTFSYTFGTTAWWSGPALNVRSTIDGWLIEECDISANWLELVNQYGFPAFYVPWPRVDANGNPVINPATGLQYMDARSTVNFTYRGIFGNPGGTVGSGGWTFRNNTIHGCWRCLNLNANGGQIIIEGNEFYDFSGDAFNISGQPNNAIVRWNKMHSVLNLAADPNHTDGGQFLGTINTTGVRYYGNRMFAGRDDVWADYPGISTGMQGPFLEDITSYNYIDMQVFLNMVVTGASWGVYFANGSQCLVAGNTTVVNPTWTSNPSSYPGIQGSMQVLPTVTPYGSLVTMNLSKLSNFASTGAPAPAQNFGTAVNNLIVLPASTNLYSDIFTGPSFDVNTIAEGEAAFVPKPGTAPLTSVPKMGALGTGYVDYEARTYDYPLANTVTAFSFTDQTGVPTSTLRTSNGIQVTNILNGQSVASVFGAAVNLSALAGRTPEFKITSDAGGVVIVRDWGTATAIAQEGQYVFVRDTSSASSGALTRVTVWIGGVSDSWTLTTA